MSCRVSCVSCDRYEEGGRRTRRRGEDYGEEEEGEGYSEEEEGRGAGACLITDRTHTPHTHTHTTHSPDMARTGSRRGFAAMPKERVRAIAAKGGRHSHGGGRRDFAAMPKERVRQIAAKGGRHSHAYAH